jgi:hypothetical protein
MTDPVTTPLRGESNNTTISAISSVRVLLLVLL